MEGGTLEENRMHNVQIIFIKKKYIYMYTEVRFQKQPGRNDKCDQYKQNQQENEKKEKEKTVIHSD